MDQQSSTIKKNQGAPQCILDIPPLTRLPTTMTEEQLDAAAKSLIHFPRERKRNQDILLKNQDYFIFTFIPSKGAKPDSDGCYGAANFRGTFRSVEDAENHAVTLVRDVDSYYDYDIGYTGQFFPLLDPSATQYHEQDDKEVSLDPNHADSITKEYINKRKEEDKKEIKSMEKRRKDLIEDTKQTVIDKTTLEYYTEVQVKLASIKAKRDEYLKCIEDCKVAATKASVELDELDEKYPEYRTTYIEQYKKALKAIKGDTHNNKLLDYMGDRTHNNNSSSSSSSSK
jgi:hypothetical protein